MNHIDLIIKNAVIHTMDARFPSADSLAVSDGRVAGVGEEKDFESLTADAVIDAGGATILPGFNDAHAHPVSAACCRAIVDLSAVRSLEDFFGLLRERASQTPPGQWVEAYGYNEGIIAEHREPTLEELDAVTPDHPMFAFRACSHIALVNSVAMRIGGIRPDTPNPPGGEIVRVNGRFTGRLCDAAAFEMKNRIPSLKPKHIAPLMKKQCAALNAVGVTSSTEMGMLMIADGMKVWDEITKSGPLTVRISVYADEPLYSQIADNWPSDCCDPARGVMLRFPGRKIILDGGGSSGTARVSTPNEHDGKSGILYYTPEQLDAAVMDAHRKGLQIATHGIGDVAIEMILSAYARAQAILPRPNIRHRIEHSSLCFAPLVEKTAALGVLTCLNPGFMYYFSATHLRNYGASRVENEIPFRSLLDLGVPIACGSDNPVTDPNPMQALYAAVTRKSADGTFFGERERVKTSEAVYAYTAAGAYFSGEEAVKGTLSTGKYADLVFLNADPLMMDDEPERLLETAVTRAIVGGATVYGG